MPSTSDVEATDIIATPSSQERADRFGRPLGGWRLHHDAKAIPIASARMEIATHRSAPVPALPGALRPD